MVILTQLQQQCYMKESCVYAVNPSDQDFKLWVCRYHHDMVCIELEDLYIAAVAPGLGRHVTRL